MNGTEQERSRWPLRLRELCRDLRTSPLAPERQQARREVWTILSHALQRYMEIKRATWSDLTQEDIEDLASEKSLHLIRKLESGEWEIEDRSGPEIAAFLATTAHNGMVDLVRRPGRRLRVREDDPESEGAPLTGELPRGDAPDTPLERSEFIEALRQCVEELEPRCRRIWFFRVLYGLPTKEIAAHPQVALKPGRVDELLFSVRQSLSRCMESKGQRLRQLPTGTFFEIWKLFRAGRLEEVGASGQVLDASC